MFVIFFGAFFTSELIPHATRSFEVQACLRIPSILFGYLAKAVQRAVKHLGSGRAQPTLLNVLG